MRRAFASVAVMSVVIGIACGADENSGETGSSPAVTTPSPELRITTFDAVEPGWGDAPVAVHFTWAIESKTGRPLTCLLDVDGDGKVDQRIDGCRPNTLREPVESLPTHSYEAPGQHVPKLVVSDGVNTVAMTQEIFANKVTFARHVVFPEKIPGFVKAEPVPNTSVVLTFASEAQVPQVNVGDILWGMSANGYLIKATEVVKAGATVSIKGVQGMVGEAIENGFIGARNVFPNYDNFRCIDDGCKDVKIEKVTSPPTLPPSIGTRSLGVGRDPLVIEGSANIGIKLDLPDVGPLSHSIFFGFHVRTFILDISFFSVRRLVFDTVGGFSYEFGFKGETPELKRGLGTFTLGTIPIGPVPIVPIVFPTVSLQASIKLSATVGLDLPTHASYTPEKGFELSIDPEQKGLVKEIADPLGVGLAFEAKAKLSFPVKALAFGVAGPYIGPVLAGVGELKIGTPQLTDNPCKNLVEVCLAAKAEFGGEYGIGCPWIESIDVKQEITAAEVELIKGCKGKEEEKDCSDAGSDGATDAFADADAAPAACVPAGTATTPPTGMPSPSTFCAGADLFWSGANTGTKSCWTIGDILFPSTTNGNRALAPKDLPTGPQTLTMMASGGQISVPVTITPGLAPRAMSISPTSAAAGTVMTVTGEGFDGITNVTVGGETAPFTSQGAPVTSNTGTVLMFSMPSLIPAGPAHVDLYKSNCGLHAIKFTAQ
jgi:hypothetical protein